MTNSTTQFDRKEAILLLQDDLDKHLSDYVKEGGSEDMGRVVVYENWDYHIQLLEDGTIPSYSDNAEFWYSNLKQLEDYDYLMEYVAHMWLENEAAGDDVLELKDQYKYFWLKELEN